MIALIASFLVSTNATAHELAAACRSTIPQTAELEGRIVLRNRKGIPQAEYGYVLRRRGGETELSLRDASGAEVPFRKDGNILGTDVTWSDLALEYLWWDDVSIKEAYFSINLLIGLHKSTAIKKDKTTLIKPKKALSMT